MFRRKRDPLPAPADVPGMNTATSKTAAPVHLSGLHRLLNFVHEMRRYTQSDDRRILEIIVALACIFVALSIGIAYSTSHLVKGWQLWMWLLCCAVITIALAPLQLHRPRFDVGLRALFIVTLLAFVLRVVSLGTIPGGLHVDEYGFARFTMEQVLTGGEQTISPFIVGQDSHPTLFFYLIRLFLAVFGYTIVGLRIPSVLAGVLAVVAMYGCVAVLSNRRVALIAVILIAAYHFHIHWSRLALNNIWDTLWVPATIGLYAWGWKNRNSAGAALSGATLGFSQYFYQGGRLGVLLLAFVIVWLWWNDRDGQRLVIHLGKLAAVAVCIAGPLFLFALAEPDPFLARFKIVLGWQPEVIQQVTGSATDYWQFFWYQLARSVGAYTAYTDITGFYRPQIPLTIGLSMIMLPIGFGWAIVKRMWVPVVWLTLATFFGGFLLGGAPSSSHYVIAIPAICWLIAIAIDLISEHGHPRVALAILVIIVLTDIIFYFGVYLSAPSTDLTLPFPPIPNLAG